MARLSSDLNGALVWSALSAADFEKTSSTEKDLTDVIDELIINIPSAKVIAVIYENQPGENGAAAANGSNVLLYTIKNVDSLALLKDWNPAGTKGLARVTLNLPIIEAEQAVIKTLREKLSKLPL